jgi:hypothetical protein
MRFISGKEKEERKPLCHYNIIFAMFITVTSGDIDDYLPHFPSL